MKKILLFISALFILSITWGQQKNRTQLSGKVSDSKTGEPLAGASVVLSDSRVGTTTDSSGYYVLKNIPVGHTVIEISSLGYKTIVDHIDIVVNTEKNFALVSSILENEGVTITAVGTATSIRKAPIPITRVSKTELLSTPSTNIIDALSHQPGVSQLSTGPAISKPIIRGLGLQPFDCDKRWRAAGRPAVGR
jgi:iron complex outermembrane receptor protein